MELIHQEETRLPLVRLFNTANAKVLDFLLANEGLEYTEDEISELTHVPDRTLQRSMQSLLGERVVKRYRKNGRVYYYSVDLSNPRVSGLLSYVNSTLLENLDLAMRESHPPK